MNSPLLALDLGLKRTGVAISENGILAQPLTVLEAKPPHLNGLIQEIIQQIKEYEIKTLIVGIPYTQDDAPTSQSLKVEGIISHLEEELKKERLSVIVTRVNEYHSSKDADLYLPDTDRDAAAATLLLQDYIDEQSFAPAAPTP